MTGARPLPESSWDCHSHVYPSMARFPIPQEHFEEQADISDYKALCANLGIDHHVIVQGKAYPDAHSLFHVIGQLGTLARGIMFLPRTVTENDMTSWHALGIRGFRFLFPNGKDIDLGEIRRGAELAASCGWHIIVQAQGETLVPVYDDLLSLPCPVVIDHIGRLPPTSRDAALAPLLQFLSAGGWLKLAAPYNLNADGQSSFAPIAQVVRDTLSAAPSRLIWGLNFPHPNLRATQKPDERDTLRSLLAILDEPEQKAVFFNNPLILYA